MRLTQEQHDFIGKQYSKYMKKKLTLKKFNENLQKYFNTDISFTKTIVECEYYNKGYADIGWLLYDEQEDENAKREEI